LRLWLRLRLDWRLRLGLRLSSALPPTTPVVLLRLWLPLRLRLRLSLRLGLRLYRRTRLLLTVTLLPGAEAAGDLGLGLPGSRSSLCRYRLLPPSVTVVLSARTRFGLRLGLGLCRLLLGLPLATSLVRLTALADILTATPILLCLRLLLDGLSLHLTTVRLAALLRHYAPLRIRLDLWLSRLRTLRSATIAAVSILPIAVAPVTVAAEVRLRQCRRHLVI
jgi:hypothetical protein